VIPIEKVSLTGISLEYPGSTLGTKPQGGNDLVIDSTENLFVGTSPGSCEQYLTDYYLSGQDRSFDLLVSSLQDYLLQGALKSLPQCVSGRHEIAEDAVQETLIEVIKTRLYQKNQWTAARNARVKTWTYRIMRNKVSSKLRRLKPERNLKDLQDTDRSENNSVSESILASIVDSHSDQPWESLAASEDFQRYRKFRDQATDEDLLLIDGVLSEKTFSEIGHTLGCSKPSVSRRFAKLVRRIENIQL
jgi:RNA polymerase sigma factor (sigma-70 family)